MEKSGHVEDVFLLRVIGPQQKHVMLQTIPIQEAGPCVSASRAITTFYPIMTLLEAFAPFFPFNCSCACHKITCIMYTSTTPQR